MKLQILGCAGGIGGREKLTTSLCVDQDILLDAGTGVARLTIDQLAAIDHVFITHSHLDHVAGLAFLVDSVLGKRTGALTVYATPDVIEALKKYLFNWVLWPDFSAIPSQAEPIMRWQPLTHGETIDLDGRLITPLSVNHTAGSSAYWVRNARDGFLFTGDMGSTPQLWERMTKERLVSKVIVDCSFTNADRELAEKSMHFCPATLLPEVSVLAPSVDILIYHLKPAQEDAIMQELQVDGARRFTAVSCGDIFEF